MSSYTSGCITDAFILAIKIYLAEFVVLIFWLKKLFISNFYELRFMVHIVNFVVIFIISVRVEFHNLKDCDAGGVLYICCGQFYTTCCALDILLSNELLTCVKK
jgi:hypothetical protein